MKTIFSGKRAIGFDFDNTIANIDKLHKKAWLDVVDALGLKVTARELFIWPVSTYTRFDNFGNIYACFMENPNITIDQSELRTRITALANKLKVSVSANLDVDVAASLYYCKEAFLQKAMTGLEREELTGYLLPGFQDFLRQLALAQPETFLFVASSTSTDSIQTYLARAGLAKYFGFVLGEDQLRSDATDAWSLRDKPDTAAAEKLLGRVREKLPDVSPAEMLYIGDDSVRDGEFAAAAGIPYIQIGKHPKVKNHFLHVQSYADLAELLNAPLLKICRVKDLHAARYLARWKTDFIGLHAIYELPEAAELHMLKLIANELTEYYPRTKTALVSRSEDSSALAKMAMAIPTDFVQFHANVDAPFKQAMLQTLHDHGRSTEAKNVVSAQQGSAKPSDIVGSYVLVDQNFHGGTGVTIDTDLAATLIGQIQAPGRTIFLAGGINPDNVVGTSRSAPATAIDIQSGLETPQKTKDIAKVNALFAALYPRRKLSDLPSNKKLVAFSLQEQAETGKVTDVATTDIDLLHADFSDGELVPGWKTDGLDAVRYWQQTNPFIPIDLHLYASSTQVINQKIDGYLAAHNNIRCIFLHVENVESLTRYRSVIAQRRDVQWSLSINYNIDATLYQQVCDLLVEQPAITDLLVCLPGKHKESWQFDVTAIRLLRKLAELNQARPVRLGIDRDVDPHRVSLASKYGVSHVVVGKYLLQSPGIAARLHNIRRSY